MGPWKKNKDVKELKPGLQGNQKTGGGGNKEKPERVLAINVDRDEIE
jgi:hypothetical protein